MVLGLKTGGGVVGGLRPAAAAIIVFLAAAAVLVLEILAARLMAPYVGVSLNTYTGIIGTVLAGISAGTWAGGRAADRFEPRFLLGPILIAGGLLAIATAPLVIVLGERLSGGTLPRIIALTAATVFLPAFVLSAVNPIVVKMQLQDLSATGRVVGRLSAIATAGALVGTYGTGFILAARLPNRTILVCVGAVLIVLGMAVWWRLARRIRATAAIATLIALLATGATAAAVEGPCKVESGYFCIRVESGGPGNSLRTLWLDDLVHSSVDLRDPRVLSLDYAKSPSRGDRRDVTARSANQGLAHRRRRLLTAALYRGGPPGIPNTVMELDQAVVDTARDDFGLHDEPGLRIEVGDARLLVKDEPAHSYDFVIGDAFSSRSSPWHLTTEEFLGEIEDLLRPKGAYLMNLIDRRASIRPSRGRHAERGVPSCGDPSFTGHKQPDPHRLERANRYCGDRC